MIRRWHNAGRTFLDRRPGTTLAAYWALAFIVTHIPPLRVPDPDAPPRLIPLDKIVHFGGFAILAWLLMNLLRRRSGLIVSILLTVLICAVYGVIDEQTQPPFNRTADAWDWVADMVGCGAGVGAFIVVARRLESSKLQVTSSNE